MKLRHLVAVALGTVALLLAAAAPGYADGAEAGSSTSVAALHATFAGLVYNGCQNDGPGLCSTSATSTECAMFGSDANPLGVLDCSYTFTFSFPRNCGPGLSQGTGTLEYQGRYLIQSLIVTIHGTTFEAEGVYEFPNTSGVLHTSITGKHQCGYTNGTQGAFSGSSQYVA